MSVVDDIKARLDIIDIVSGYANLQKAGRNYKALCPFHQERTPSFVVFPDTQTWRCFGACGEGGDIFSFVMKIEGWDFSETLRELAKRAGIELTPQSPQQIEQASETEQLRELLEEAARFFHDRLLNAPEADHARAYVQKRHLGAEAVEAFVIGYAPDDWRQALEHLQMRGYSQDMIIDAGVAIRNEKGNVYDRFRNRLMIPIRDNRGHTVGFGARALDPEDRAKYLNSPQGPLFDKSRLLFGLDMARRTIRETETVVVVEGYMDVIQAYQAGFGNVVAQMGTALTETQLRQLDRYASRLILALDPDTAGVNATMRGLNVARETLEGEHTVTFDPRGMMRYTGMLDMDIKVVSLPAGQDPDDLIRENPDAWEDLLQRAVPVADYVIDQRTAHLDNRASLHEREQIARELLPILTATESDIQRSGNIQALARRVHIDERTLLQWTHRQQAAATRPQPSLREQRRLAGRPQRSAKTDGAPGQSIPREGFCLRLLLEQPERLFAANRKLRELNTDDAELGMVLAPLGADDFSRTDYQIIFRELEQSLYQDDLEPLDYLRECLTPELFEVVEALRIEPLDSFQQHSGRMWVTELESIQRDQARINSQPRADTTLLIEDVLTLRHNRLERERHELYFVQQDAPGDDLTDQAYHATVKANVRARRLIYQALQKMRGFSRERS
ncbi:MAG: DNA primase [Anaerolineae bacterium]|nr:DNA primase [Anaerolineae bacterium]